MDTQPPPPGESGSNTSRLVDATSNTEILGTPQECRHKLVRRDATNVGTKHTIQDAHSQILRKSASGKNKKQHAFGCEYILFKGNGSQVTV
jgi:hypothetical protein